MQKTKSVSQDVLDLAEELGIGERIYEILDLTQEMFPGTVVAETGHDPEWPDDRWITLNVEATGAFKEIIERECEWHRRLTGLIPGRLGLVALSIMPR